MGRLRDQYNRLSFNKLQDLVILMSNGRIVAQFIFAMQVRFTLALKNVLLVDRHVDEISLEWTSEASPQDVLEMSQEWITSHNFLAQRLAGVKRVGNSSFTIEPLEEKS
jgi:hypothetical protein